MHGELELIQLHNRFIQDYHRFRIVLFLFFALRCSRCAALRCFALQDLASIKAPDGGVFCAGALPGLKYSVSVAVKNSLGMGPYSEIIEFTMPCAEPGPGMYTVKVCDEPNRVHTKFAFAKVCPYDYYRTAVYKQGSSSELGADADGCAPCVHPNDNFYTNVTCNPGSDTSVGSNGVLTPFLLPKNAKSSDVKDGELLLVNGESGSYNTLGNEATFSKCTQPADGEYVIQTCVARDPVSTLGVDTVLAKCTQPQRKGGVEYVVQQCVAGNSSVLGTNTLVKPIDSAGTSFNNRQESAFFCYSFFKCKLFDRLCF